MIPWWAYSLASNVSIIATEYFNRIATGGWLSVLPQTIPLIIVAQYCLYRTFNGASNWFAAWIVFSVGNSVMRIASVWWLAETEVSRWDLTTLGVAVMLLGSYIVKRGMA